MVKEITELLTLLILLLFTTTVLTAPIPRDYDPAAYRPGLRDNGGLPKFTLFTGGTPYDPSKYFPEEGEGEGYEVKSAADDIDWLKLAMEQDFDD